MGLPPADPHRLPIKCHHVLRRRAVYRFDRAVARHAGAPALIVDVETGIQVEPCTAFGIE